MNVFYCVIAFKQAQTVYTNDLFFSYYNFTTFAPASLSLQVTTHLTLTNAVLVHALHERVYLGPVSNETMIYTTTDIQERRVKTMNMLVVKEVPANNASNKKMPPKPR